MIYQTTDGKLYNIYYFNSRWVIFDSEGQILTEDFEFAQAAGDWLEKRAEQLKCAGCGTEITGNMGEFCADCDYERQEESANDQRAER